MASRFCGAPLLYMGYLPTEWWLEADIVGYLPTKWWLEADIVGYLPTEWH